MIRLPEIKIESSLLPSKKWKINEQGKWRAYSQDEQELLLANYPVHNELPQQLTLPTYSDTDYERSFQSNWINCKK